MDLATLKQKHEEMQARFQGTVAQADKCEADHKQLIANANAQKGACMVLEQLIADEESSAAVAKEG